MVTRDRHDTRGEGHGQDGRGGDGGRVLEQDERRPAAADGGGDVHARGLTGAAADAQVLGGAAVGMCWDSRLVPLSYSHNTGVNGSEEFKHIVQQYVTICSTRRWRCTA